MESKIVLEKKNLGVNNVEILDCAYGVASLFLLQLNQ